MINEQLSRAIEDESQKFEKCYNWLETAMPPRFFEEITHENMMLVTHNLMGFDLQEFFCTINLKRSALVLCLDSPDADLKILENYRNFGIKNYITFVSRTPPPFPNVTSNLRVAIIYFTGVEETSEIILSKEEKESLMAQVKDRNPHLTEREFDKLISYINAPFFKSLSTERLVLALDMFFRAETRDNCQYEVRYEEDWKETGKPSMQIVLAWRNTPKNNFLYRLAYVIQRFGIVMKRVNATYIDPYSNKSILILSLALHGANGEACWDVANIPDFLRELTTEKYFATFDIFNEQLVEKGMITGLMGNLLRAMTTFIHQSLVNLDPNLYVIENIEEALTAHPDIIQTLIKTFEKKFHPSLHDHEEYLELEKTLFNDITSLDTGNEEFDARSKNVFLQAANFIKYCLKTNIYRQNYTALSFRVDPKYLDHIPIDRPKKFPELPYAIFYVKGLQFFGYHIRFKDLSRGGLRTIYPNRVDQALSERNQVFTECYNLAYTQQLKNKEIPEGGSKGVIFLQSDAQISSEIEVLKKEFSFAQMTAEEIELKIEQFKADQKVESLYQAQRAYIENILTIVNCEPDGTLRAKNIVDYWKKPEYLYLGPDENMHNSMIQWISNASKKFNYKPMSAFISGKPEAGINHKEYGVTSLGLNVYVEEILKYAGINPFEQKFTVKISGGPDGDVAGNEILNLHRFYPKTAKILALTDISGTIYDPEGLDLKILSDLFYNRQPIRFYPPGKLHENGFLLDRETKKQDTVLSLQTLLWKKTKEGLIEDWLSGSQMNAIYRQNVHKVAADIFIPAGGRPRALNENNVKEFLDEKGNPTSRLIVEGANLYLTPGARRFLEKLGVLIIRDSSANKGGVICSSYEVLANLALPDDVFMENKDALAKDILARIHESAYLEARLLLSTHARTKGFLTDISLETSQRLNLFKYQLLDYLDKITIPMERDNPFIRCFLDYVPKTLKDKFEKELLSQIPEHHMKACIASRLATYHVYHKGLDWMPSIVDILPLALKEVST